MQTINWLKVNLGAALLFVVAFIVPMIVINFDPSSCADTGLCSGSLPTPFLFTILYFLCAAVLGIAVAVSTISLVGIFYKKIISKTAFSWWRILVACVISLVPIFVGVSEISFYWTNI